MPADDLPHRDGHRKLLRLKELLDVPQTLILARQNRAVQAKPTATAAFDRHSTMRSSPSEPETLAAAMFTDTRIDIAETELHELEEVLEALGHPRFHARQIFQWVYRRGITDFALMSDLGRDLRAQLAAACVIT